MNSVINLQIQKNSRTPNMPLWCHQSKQEVMMLADTQNFDLHLPHIMSTVISSVPKHKIEIYQQNFHIDSLTRGVRHVCACSVVSDFATLWIVACLVVLSMGFPRQEYRNRLPLPLQRIFLTQGSNSCLLHLLSLASIFFTIELPGETRIINQRQTTFLWKLPKLLLSLKL